MSFSERSCASIFVRKITKLLIVSYVIFLENGGFFSRFVDGFAVPKGKNHPARRPSSRPTAKTVRKSSLPKQSSKIAAKVPIERTVVILYNKPPNVITSHESQDARPTVYDDIQSMRGFIPTETEHVQYSAGDTSVASFADATGIRSKLHAIGRLDADTTGLLLLTNDGRLLHHVTNPNAKTQDHELFDDAVSSKSKTKKPSVIHKTYEALIMGHHTDDSLDRLRHGVDIGKNYVTKPLPKSCDLKVLDHPNHKSTVVSITIGEGKNRQVRKMFHAIGSGVMKLKRTRIGSHLTLKGVNEGQWRVLTDNEVRQFLNWKPRELVPEAPEPAKRFSTTRRRRRRR